jgi:hypothetical protein
MRKVPGSNLGNNTVYSESGFPQFPLVSPGKRQDIYLDKVSADSSEIISSLPLVPAFDAKQSTGN